MKKRKIFIVIPAYNEEKVISKVITNIRKEGLKDIVVVDDGSFDRTKEKAKNAKAKVLKHFLNRGKGAAVKTGLEYAKLKKADIVVTIDGDGQHNPKDIKKMIKKIDEGYEIVLGSRFLKNKNKIPLFNKIANYLANIIVFMMYNLWVSDSQSGFRAYSKTALNKIDTKFDKYEFDSEVIREIARNKIKFCEIPIDVLYTKYSVSKAQKQGLKNGIKTLFKMILSG